MEGVVSERVMQHLNCCVACKQQADRTTSTHSLLNKANETEEGDKQWITTIEHQILVGISIGVRHVILV